jgi:hypothetical protein
MPQTAQRLSRAAGELREADRAEGDRHEAQHDQHPRHEPIGSSKKCRRRAHDPGGDVVVVSDRS